ncbi:hypothetical protein GGTG_05686 [Gaeumannomyces tritici R3-111a-1]|uniref:Uncharacterized protein n=1 Tax=Gaeumannomyces tritici (strain R3-111a-1) TaxID=644352 RepID=J3NWM4_GAET3|nr:hypothetical protein GGTG_05686 [Gaeumannomyces tritici R3-111a-1]EJT75756.1 hypothetical protein GGTG_05686 [Gaeumannomyces tritici R3-111a-1]
MNHPQGNADRPARHDFGAIGTPIRPRPNAPTPSVRDDLSSPPSAIFSPGVPSGATNMSSVERSGPSTTFIRQGGNSIWDPAESPSQWSWCRPYQPSGHAQQLGGCRPGSPTGTASGLSGLPTRVNTPETTATLEGGGDEQAAFLRVSRRLYPYQQQPASPLSALPSSPVTALRDATGPQEQRLRMLQCSGRTGNSAALTLPSLAEQAVRPPTTPGSSAPFAPALFAPGGGGQAARQPRPTPGAAPGEYAEQQRARRTMASETHAHQTMSSQNFSIYRRLPSPAVQAPPSIESIMSGVGGLRLADSGGLGGPPSTDRVFHPMESTARAQQERQHFPRQGGPTRAAALGGGGFGDEAASGAVSSTPVAITRIMAGFSPNYRGNINIDRNRSAAIPEHENCSLFILGLPADLTTRQLLAGIRNIGRVYATHINRPEPSRGHMTCAAKVIFFDREPAARFHAACSPENGGFVVGGMRTRVLWNRIRTAAQPAGPPAASALGPWPYDHHHQHQSQQQQQPSGPDFGMGFGNAAANTAVDRAGRHRSRVLLIYGPARFVNFDSLTAYFRSKLEFQIDEVLTLAMSGQGPDDGVLLEYRFGSFRCQAEAAKMALTREHQDTVRVWFGVDPCDVRPPRPNPRPAALSVVMEEDETRESDDGPSRVPLPFVDSSDF